MSIWKLHANLVHHNQLRLDVESRVWINRILGWLPADGAELLEGIAQDEHIR